MRPNSSEDVSTILDRILDGTVSRADVKLLLYEIREYVPKNTLLKDIANCIHPHRNQGMAFNHAKKHIENFIEVAKNGGVLAVEAIPNQDKVIAELTSTLSVLGFASIEADLKKHSNRLIELIAESMDGTDIVVKSEEIERCRIKLLHDNYSDTDNLCFVFWVKRPIDGVLKLVPNVGIAMPLFINFTAAS